MKNLTINMMIAAAALVAVAGTASAQTLEAKIPFAFRASGKVFAPGTYRVQMVRGTTGVPLLKVYGKENGDGVLAMGQGNRDPKKAWVEAGSPVLTFQCGVGRCALAEVWIGDPGVPAYTIATPKLGKDEYRTTAEIVMHRVQGE